MSKTRKILFFGSTVLFLVFVGAAVYSIATETQHGRASSRDDLTTAAGRLSVMRSFADTSKLWDFPYAYPVSWTRMRMRPQFHWSGKGDPIRIAQFLGRLGTPVVRHLDEKGRTTKVSFILAESDIHTEGNIDVDDGSFSFQAIQLRDAQPAHSADGSQPSRDKSNSTPAAAGFRH
jgi:hypothetical protein